jgi:hypothetical protein
MCFRISLIRAAAFFVVIFSVYLFLIFSSSFTLLSEPQVHVPPRKKVFAGQVHCKPGGFDNILNLRADRLAAHG